jgi:hypothetical protein
LTVAKPEYVPSTMTFDADGLGVGVTLGDTDALGDGLAAGRAVLTTALAVTRACDSESFVNVVEHA